MKIVSSYFKNSANFQKALVHRSYCNEHPNTTSNERLEFLGDSVLSLIISHRLYTLLPDSPEGDLTARRSYLVQTSSLAQKAKDLRLDAKLLLSRGEEDTGGRTNTGLLANTFEAVLGALYLDRGQKSCEKFLFDIFPDSELLAEIAQTKDPKSLLQEKAQAKGLGTPLYSTLQAAGPDHAKVFTIAVHINGKLVATGQGNSKQRAETAAAQEALTAFAPVP